MPFIDETIIAGLPAVHTPAASPLQNTIMGTLLTCKEGVMEPGYASVEPPVERCTPLLRTGEARVCQPDTAVSEKQKARGESVLYGKLIRQQARRKEVMERRKSFDNSHKEFVGPDILNSLDEFAVESGP